MTVTALAFVAWSLIALVCGVGIGLSVRIADHKEQRRRLADVTFVRSARDYDDLANRLDREQQR